MKKTLVLMSFVAGLILMGVFASAASGIVMRGDVPFDFYVENQLLPAGEYDFAMGVIGNETASSVAVRTKDGSVVAFLTTKSDSEAKATAGQLKFNHYSGKYFLSSVECPGYKANLKTTTHEKEMMVQPDTEQIALALK